ncbi:hypothetical protein CcI6DRAFT_01358 [Frankia sp. CcI6]|nr:hypothetical protein CcI6DRAFT_01358 [Frankia sp. CcI6]KDA40927.1 hypothetical protein BMG523Draft_04272 [Frankia sp. BMG5.23]KEZ37005.1 hypothetical protein CEDDRAFT_01532 [Frankia sp. CeD]KFB03791.1 hypothetical protein ALLO2DRAFT_03462 [Frankia sp. Allo2]OAA21280.1 hypothetical protein AAY23_108031 [Frankia casuarinae]
MRCAELHRRTSRATVNVEYSSVQRSVWLQSCRGDHTTQRWSQTGAAVAGPGHGPAAEGRPDGGCGFDAVALPCDARPREPRIYAGIGWSRPTDVLDA